MGLLSSPLERHCSSALPDYCVIHVWYVQAYEGRVSCGSTSFTLDRLEDQRSPCWCVGSVSVTWMVHAACLNISRTSPTSCIKLCHTITGPPQGKPQTIAVECNATFHVLEHKHHAPVSVSERRVSHTHASNFDSRPAYILSDDYLLTLKAHVAFRPSSGFSSVRFPACQQHLNRQTSRFAFRFGELHLLPLV